MGALSGTALGGRLPGQMLRDQTAGRGLGQGDSEVRPGSSSRYTNVDDTVYMVDYLEKSYDKNSQFYKFTYTFYNLVDRTKPRPERPAAVNQHLWGQATRLNPDPDNLYPVIVFGYDDLFERLEKQKRVIEKLEGSRRYLGEKVNELIENGALKLANRIISITDKYNALIMEILETIGRLLGKDAGAPSVYHDQLEKRVGILSNNLARLSSNIGNMPRSLDDRKEEGVCGVLEEQKKILFAIGSSLNKRYVVEDK